MKGPGWAFLFWLVIAAPLASAQATVYPLESTIVYESIGLDEPPTGEYHRLEFVNQKFHDYTSLGYAWLLEASVTPSIIMADSGSWNFTVELDGAPIPGCFALLETVQFGGFLSAGLPTAPTFNLRCGLPTFTDPETPSSHNLTFHLIPQTGTPSEPDSISLSVQISREDYIMVPQDANEISEAAILFAPIILQVLLLFMMHREEHVFPAYLTGGLSILVGIMAALAMPEGVESLRVVVVGLMLYAALKAVALSQSHQEA